MEKKNTTNALLTVAGILILAMIVVTTCTLHFNVLIGIFRLTSLIFVALYCFWLYKIPHGNMLKYAMLLFAAANILNTALVIPSGFALERHIIRLFAATGVVYCAGRLNRIEQNKIILTVIDVVLFMNAAVGVISNRASFGLMMTLRSFVSPVTLATLMIAYFVRYNEHISAGLAGHDPD